MKRIRFRAQLTCCLLVLAPWLVSAQLPDPTRFASAIEAFEAADADNPLPENAIVLLGSSSFRLWSDASEALAPLTVINRGFGGSVMHDALYYSDRIAINYKPRAILVYEGDNDTGMAEPLSQDQILGHLDQLVEKVHAALPDTRIYILAVKPSILRERVWPSALALNAAYRARAENDPLLYYIDIATPLLDESGKVLQDIFVADDLHLNDKGYDIWSQAIRAALMPIEAQYE